MDATKLIIFDGDNFNILSDTNYENNDLYEYNLTAIQYFDVNKEKFMIIQFILHQDQIVTLY